MTDPKNTNDSSVHSEDFNDGFTKIQSYPKKITCTNCNGDGVIEEIDEDGTALITCPLCEGRGKYVDDSDYTE